MPAISSARLTAPNPTAREIRRKKIIDAVVNSNKRLVYVHGGAGYGKTTLLSQLAALHKNAVWLTLDEEGDVLTFVNALSEATRRTLPAFDFTAAEYLIYEQKNNFLTILANAFLSSMEKSALDVLLIIDDLQTIEDPQIKKLIARIMRHAPEHIRLCLGSREAPWPELVPLLVRDEILEITQQKLAFTRDEAAQILGFADEAIYSISEGWPIAITLFKVLWENGVSLPDVPARGSEALYSYLFYECYNRLSPEMADFFQATACFKTLDSRMLDAVMQKKDTGLLLETLVSHNIFTIRMNDAQYRYHALFREYLLSGVAACEKISWQNKALQYYFAQKDYAQAAEYAINAENSEMLQRIIVASYKDYIKNGNFSELRVWFKALEDTPAISNGEFLLAKGVFLSSIGNFSQAQTCLEEALPLLSADDRELQIDALLHKARVLRNSVSFEESNKLLDELLDNSGNLPHNKLYAIAIEKIYNLCLNAQITDAYALSSQMIEACARAGDLQVKAWFERYLCAIHFFAGRIKDAVHCYEKSLAIPENERQYLDTHNVGIYAAKSYQVLGEENKAVSIISTELQKLRSTGRYEEMWIAYSFAAEIHYHIAYRDRMNGGGQTFETAIKYFTLADEYSLLYRTSRFQMQWAKMQRLICSLMFDSGNKEFIVNEIIANLDDVNDYSKTIALGRLFVYFTSVSDFPSAVKYAKLSIEIGERSNIMIIPIIAYGILARAAITLKDQDQAQAVQLTAKYLQLCAENGIYEFFRIKKVYFPILEFALANGIELAFTEQLMALAGYKTKKAYIKTLGGFSVFPYKNRQEPLKIRTKKARELLAFMLDAGSEGVTKEQIYNAIWAESETNDVKRLIGVNLTNIKYDLACIGIENPIINQGKHYSISREEIALDIDLFTEAAAEFKLQNSKEAAQKILELYKGEYLSDFEAFWAVSKRLKYAEIYEVALKYCLQGNQVLKI